MRLGDLQSLIWENRLSADADARQQILQEFLFHAVGATEYVAQLVNDRRGLGLPENEVSSHKIAKIFAQRNSLDPILAPMKALSVDTRKDPLPPDPYSADGLLYRLVNYRNEVTHRNMNPFHFVLSAGPRVAYLWLDPRQPDRGRSTAMVHEDLSSMLTVVGQRCRAVLTFLTEQPCAPETL